MSESSDGDTLSSVTAELAHLDDQRAIQVSVVIPARNEARNLAYVLNRIPDDVFEIILVDGQSVDDTVAVAQRVRPGINVVRQVRSGKGNALATGFAACRGDYVVMMDADGSMDPAEMDLFVAALDRGADYVKGSRFLAGGGSADITRLRRLGNHLLTAVLNTLYRTRYSDLCYGYNAFRRRCIPAFRLPNPADPSLPPQLGDGFEIETLLTLRVLGSGLSVQEVPSFESRRLFGASNLHAVRDGCRTLATILRERLRRRPADAVPPASADAAEGVLDMMPRTDGGSLGTTG
jgi:glycosyltransferase involved in cell wall biosynthesis